MGKAREKFWRVIHVVMVIVIIAAALFIFWEMKKSRGPEITSALVGSRLETVSELTSAKMTYSGFVHSEEGTIPFLTQKAYFMTYEADVKAGIDLAGIDKQITVTDSAVTISLPEITILDIKVKPDSIEFYDQKVALFNGEKKQDALDAIRAAEEDVTAKADIEGLKDTAKSQIELLFTALLKDSIGERTLVIKYK